LNYSEIRAQNRKLVGLHQPLDFFWRREREGEGNACSKGEKSEKDRKHFFPSTGLLPFITLKQFSDLYQNLTQILDNRKNKPYLVTFKQSMCSALCQNI
jgi:hypothetical protein